MILEVGRTTRRLGCGRNTVPIVVPPYLHILAKMPLDEGPGSIWILGAGCHHELESTAHARPLAGGRFGRLSDAEMHVGVLKGEQTLEITHLEVVGDTLDAKKPPGSLR